MEATNSAQVFEGINNDSKEKPYNEPMFFFKGVIIGGSFSLILWAIIFWVIT
ncbi:MAG: hypothetical protein U9N83_17900 [Thermodesulfobacteriota bacterium]|nr:hypothetical protein [Thermodesulfobacteriota bacterium]